MKVELSEEAKLQAREENAWWRKNRDSKGVFIEELREARKALRDGPKHQVYAYLDGEPVRLILAGRCADPRCIGEIHGSSTIMVSLTPAPGFLAPDNHVRKFTRPS